MSDFQEVVRDLDAVIDDSRSRGRAFQSRPVADKYPANYVKRLDCVSKNGDAKKRVRKRSR